MRHAIRSLAVLIVIGGCGSPDPMSDRRNDRDLRDGINWISAEPGKRLDGVYQHGDLALFFELRRGGRMEDVPVGELPQPMVDGRLMDSEGRVLMWQIAADEFIDPTWGTVADIYDVTPEHVVQQMAAYSSADRHAPLGRPFLAALAITTPPDGNAVEVHALGVMLASFTDSNPLEDTSGALDVTAEKGSSNGGSYYHKIQVHAGGCCCPGCEHSATKSLYKNCSACQTRVYVNRCNHGRCPGDEGMSLKCSSVWWGARLNQYPKGDHSCTTQYDVTSTSGHNCNDDSEYQGRSVKANAYQDPDDGYPCNNWSTHATGPDCDF